MYTADTSAATVAHTGNTSEPTPGRPGLLACPECAEPVRATPPAAREWLLAGWMPRPGYSHHDGTPLCPVPGPNGSQPACPVRADGLPM